MIIHDDSLDTFEASQGVQAVIDRLNNLARKGGYVFRGYGRQDELFPNIIREGNYADIESSLLKDFEKYGSSYFHASTPIDFMSCGQHFGLPTRLLDFTYNPFIALSFALYMPKNNNYREDNDKDYYYIRYALLEDNFCVPSIPLRDELYNMEVTRSESLATKACQCIDSVSDLFEKNITHRNISSLVGFTTLKETDRAQEKIRKRAILFVDPNQSNQRIIMQQGLFMFPYTLNKDEHLKILNNNSSYIKISKDLRDELLRYLDTLGYNTFRLMPDLGSICNAVKRRNIDERKRNSKLFKKKGIK